MRYLLYDGRCSSCSAMAAAAIDELGEWATPLKLHDERAQALLAQAGSAGLWRPALVCTDDATAKVYVGWRMRLKIAAGVGPRTAWRVMAAVSRAKPEAPTDPSRRRFILGSAATAATAIFGTTAAEALASGHAKRRRGKSVTASERGALQRNAVVAVVGRVFGTTDIADATSFRGGYIVPIENAADPAQAMYLLLPDDADEVRSDLKSGIVLRWFFEAERGIVVAHTPTGFALGAWTTDKKFAGMSSKYLLAAGAVPIHPDAARGRHVKGHHAPVARVACSGGTPSPPTSPVSPATVIPTTDPTQFLRDWVSATEVSFDDYANAMTAWAGAAVDASRRCVLACIALYALLQFECIGSCQYCSQHPSVDHCLLCKDCLQSQGEYHLALALCIAACRNPPPAPTLPKVCPITP
jgi:predicted DCC family thiol-disulfide oxidoreductase YuxK